MAKRISDEIASEEIKRAKSDTENNVDKTEEELVDAKAEKFLLLCNKTFSEYHEKKLNNENNANLDCDDGVVSSSLTKISKKSEKAFTQIKKKVKLQNS